jgi:hypothetical protein
VDVTLIVMKVESESEDEDADDVEVEVVVLDAEVDKWWPVEEKKERSERCSGLGLGQGRFLHASDVQFSKSDSS